jgi:hypothetical protein
MPILPVKKKPPDMAVIRTITLAVSCPQADQIGNTLFN